MPEIYAIAVKFEEKASPPNHLRRDQVFVFIFVFVFVFVEFEEKATPPGIV